MLSLLCFLLNMSDESSTAFRLVPEIALLEPLPDHLRQRFEHALLLMHEEVEEPLTWQQIANKSAISPYHFHRQFSELFNQTPGQYLTRIRLQYAIGYLLSGRPGSITEIAVHCGFSSSQSLGKALKREVGMTAKEIRVLGETGTPAELTALMRKIGHPGESSSMEAEMASNMPCELVFFPPRGMKKLNLKSYDWDDVFETYGFKSEQLMSALPVAHLESAWNENNFVIGNWRVKEKQYDFFIAEGYYFCCEVYLATDVAYVTAQEILFSLIEEQGYQIDEKGHFVEVVKKIEVDPIEAVIFSFQVPVILEEQTAEDK